MDRVCLAYLDALGPNAQAVVQHRKMRRILDRRASANLFHLLRTPTSRFRRSLVARALRHGLSRSCAGKGRLYLNVGHTGLNNPGLRTWLRDADVRPVYFIHDLIPITHPEYCRAGEDEKHRERLRTVLDSAVGVIGNSQATLEDLRGFASREGRTVAPSIAALLGSDALPSSQSTAGEHPTFVVLGTIEARKNHLMLLQVWRRLVHRMGSNAPRLLVIGQRGWECEQALGLLDRSAFLKEAVTEIGRCDDKELARHLSTARALLFPSLAEGYGLPLAEALRAGVPAIASDLPVFREIAGNVPEYLDPLDAPAWERAVVTYSDDTNAVRKEQLRRLKDFSAPSWTDHFATVNSWLATL